MFLPKPRNLISQKNHNLARDLLTAYLYQYLLTGGLTPFYDSLSRNHSNPVQFSVGTTWAGNGYTFAAGVGQHGNAAYSNTVLPEFRTFAMRLTPYTTTGTFMSWGSTVADAFPYFISSFARTYIDANWNITYSDTNFIVGEENTYVLTQNTDRIWRVYLNGRELGSYNDGGDTTRSTGETNFYVGGGFDGYPKVTVHGVYIYGRGFQQNEPMQLHQDFYAPFRPKRRTISIVTGTAPTAPSNLAAYAVSSSQINCTWTDNSADETGFELQYDTNSGFATATTATPAADATSYNVTGLTASTLYYFRLRAVNAFGNSAYTATVSAMTLAASRVLAWSLTIAWDGTTYIDESARLISAMGQMRLSPPGDSITSGGGIVDSCTLTLQNADGRYSPLLSAGALYANLQNGGAYHRPVILTVSIDGGGSYTTVFTGVIKIPKEIGPNSRDGATVEIECRSRDELILTSRLSTLLSNFVTYHDSGTSEADILDAWLQGAGIASGDLVIDAGYFNIPWAWLDDESPLADGWLLAAACGGRLYSTPDGKFRYENASHWLTSPHTTSQASITPANATKIQPWYNDGELYNAVTVEVSERTVLEAGELWEADDVVVVPPNSTITHTARMRQPAYVISELEYTAVTSGGLDITSDVTINRTDYAQRSILSITNANATQAARLVVLRLNGQAISGRPGAEVTETSADSFWTGRIGRTRTIRGNVYIQSMAQAGFVAEFLKDRHEAPRLFWKMDGVPGDPARRLGDRLTVYDSAIMDSSRDVFVTSIMWRLSNTGYNQNMEGVDAADLYPYGDTTPGYFVIGTSTLAVANSDYLFY